MKRDKVAEEVMELKYTPKDFQSKQDVKWCAGCGGYAVLSNVHKTFAHLNIPKEKFVWVSGIGCSSRFTYYVDTYGIHSIHGRALPIATGIKTSNPDLSVWVATGDGDLMSIGGNHFIHTCRKNVDLKVLLFNNKIYGLTKGQYSPTSEKGKITKTSPYGTIDHPFNPPSLALGAGATFVARSLDRDPKHLHAMIERAGDHTGTAFVEVLQNCVIFNDGAYAQMSDKSTRNEVVLYLEDDKPMIFGNDKDKGIRLDGFTPQIVDLNDGKWSVNDLWVHKERDPIAARSFILAHFEDFPNMPTPLGVYRQFEKSTYDGDMETQIEGIKEKEKYDGLFDLLKGTNTWEVTE